MSASHSFRGVFCIMVAVSCFSLQDATIKWLSGDYPLHEIVLIRALIAITLLSALIYWEGGLIVLRSRRPGLHIARALLIVIANSSFFLGLAAMPLAEAMAIFFIAPLLITALAAVVLNESVGPRRWLGVSIGLVGVLIVLRPTPDEFRVEGLLPLIAATAYALMQTITRRLGATDSASAMAFYVQVGLIVVSSTMGLSVGDGRFAPGTNPSLDFLLRGWIVPPLSDGWVLGGVGCLSAVGAYLMSQAYRLSEPSLVAPFEYVALPLSIMWGYVYWRELPDQTATLGIALILASGLYVLHRETVRRRERESATQNKGTEGRRTESKGPESNGTS
ncbi:MAG: DMT family transporter [Pseudomonadota bacterium]